MLHVNLGTAIPIWKCLDTIPAFCFVCSGLSVGRKSFQKQRKNECIQGKLFSVAPFLFALALSLPQNTHTKASIRDFKNTTGYKT